MGRTAPPVPTTTVVPLIRCADLRCTQEEARFALTGEVCLPTATAEVGSLEHLGWMGLDDQRPQKSNPSGRTPEGRLPRMK